MEFYSLDVSEYANVENSWLESNIQPTSLHDGSSKRQQP